MLISLPFLTGDTGQDDEGGSTLGELAGQGAFPLSHQFGWHGGIHLQAPGNLNNPEQVRAIADGTVVFARDSNRIPEHDTDPAIMAAHPLLYYRGWTSNGVIILQHLTEIGEGVTVTFYSIYQHIHALAKRTETVTTKDAKGHVHKEAQERPLQKGDRVYRKDPIGKAGVIYGQPNRIHLEIVADAANVAALMGRNSGSMGRASTTRVWGDMHIRVPVGTPYYADDPSKAKLAYTVRLYDSRNPRANETLDRVAAQFATTPERLHQLNADLITRLRHQYAKLSDDDWFSAVSGTHQNFYQLAPPDNPRDRTLSVPAVWGSGPVPASMPPELLAHYEVKPLGRTSDALMVSLSESRGTLTLTTRDASGKTLGTATECSYDAYAQATARYPGCPSAGYELLRFGRVLGPDALAASDQYRGHVPHLRKIKLHGSDVYIDLNVPGVQVYSDADFPEWQGWTFIDDDIDGNSRCDSTQLLDLILAQLPPPAALSAEAIAHRQAMPPEARAREKQRDRLLRAHLGCNDRAVRERLKRCMVKMPTEWARDDFDTRWGWVRNTQGDLPANVLLSACLTPEAYEKFRRHHAALAFWEDAKAEGLSLDKVHYHFHPKLFIETFKKCGWLSEEEFTQMLPNEVLNEVGHSVFIEPVRDSYAHGTIAINHRVPLNKTLRKYAINTPARMAAFFGNALEETQWLSKLREGDSTRWYYPWDGRGFLQLTGPVNYLGYWDFRGRGGQIDKTTRDALTHAQAQANTHRSTAQSYIGDSVSGVTALLLGWRDQVSAGGHPKTTEDDFAPSDSAGYYWARMHMALYADRRSALQRREVSAIHHPDYRHPNAPNPTVTKIYYHNDNFRDASAAVNLPAAVGHPNQAFNGYIARCVPYAQALAVLDDVQFPDASGELILMFPEGRTPRRE